MTAIRLVTNDDGGTLHPPIPDGVGPLPDPAYLADSQTTRAMRRMEQDPSGFPGFTRVRALRDLLGPFAPGELILIGGRQENGKSLVAQNLADDLIGQGVPTLYVGLEQAPHELRIKHACLRAGVHPSSVLKPSPEFKRSAEYPAVCELVRTEIAWLKSPDVRRLLVFCPVPRVNAVVLEQWTTGAVKRWGVRCVIVDHIDHMDHGGGFNAVHELTETVHLAKELARRHEIAMVCLSQIRRPGDSVNAYTPPQAHEFAGSSAKERTADIMASIWRPLRTDMTPKDLRAVMEQSRLGSESGSVMYRPGIMGVRKVKDRLGETPGQQVMLRVIKGRLEDPPPKYAEPYGGRA